MGDAQNYFRLLRHFVSGVNIKVNFLIKNKQDFSLSIQQHTLGSVNKQLSLSKKSLKNIYVQYSREISKKTSLK